MEMTMREEDQKAVIVGRLHAGEYFGERTLLLGANATATLVVASDDATARATPHPQRSQGSGWDVRRTGRGGAQVA